MQLSVKTFLLFCIFTCLSTLSYAQKQTTEKTTIYAFGCTTCLGDSAVYLSAVMPIDSANIDKKTGFLLYCDQYARQMEKSLNEQYGEHFTCALFYARKKEKAEKKYVKLRTQLSKSKNIKLYEIPSTVFQFLPLTVSH